MKLQNQIKRIGVILSLIFIFDAALNVTPSVAQEKCGNTEPVEASKTNKTVELKKIGIKIKIPSNFRTLLRNDGSISILDPGSFEAVRCKAPHGLYYFNIKLLPNPKKLSLVELARTSYSTALGAPIKLHNYRQKNTQALVIDAQGAYGAYGIFNVPRKGTVEMSAVCDCEVDKKDIIRYLEVTELIK
ncbi:hypothetical protein H6G76_35045 [Nostoc sp. FACHB-152]|uniref:hypothetical protein n=1 Tax=Nostoc sp. FACHB-152 TaxID=2692837 RepID=UPI0016884AFD|nr:hypothetical protein [Nostoc sp. FACHB-152]MBD2452228.1 hypothetical protein [Nostoc sp. FACHB-152]